VLDTNVVLDLFVFRNPHCAGLAAALTAAPGGWIATASMRAEFDDVMARKEFAPWALRREAAAAHWADLATRASPAPPCELRCTDPDDQMFLDLAVSLRPCWLLSRDADLLRLRRRAAALNVRIATPIEWEHETGRGDPLDRPVP
jgi:uncharacterized protein